MTEGTGGPIDNDYWEEAGVNFDLMIEQSRREQEHLAELFKKLINTEPIPPTQIGPLDWEGITKLGPTEDYLIPPADLNQLAAQIKRQRIKQRAHSVFAWTALILGTIFTLGLIMIAHRPLISWANGRKHGAH